MEDDLRLALIFLTQGKLEYWSQGSVVLSVLNRARTTTLLVMVMLVMGVPMAAD